MAMTSEWFGPAERDERESETGERDAPIREPGAARTAPARTEAAQTAAPRAKSVASGAQKKIPSLLVQLDPALKELLERKDDRLLRDIGLSRESPFGEVARFWAEWSRQRGPWGQ